MMRVIGLTGGIGTGKSTASEYLRKQGFSIIDADRISREIVEPGTLLLKELEKNFGSGIIKDDGTLDRKALAAIVFSDKEKKSRLDGLMHGHILDEIERKISESQSGEGRGIIVDAPLLFETGLEKKCDQVWLITADEKLRILRVCERDGMDPEEVRARIQNQMADEEKKERAHRIVDNSGSKEALLAQLAELIEAENL
ncbi:dephospho-CoA kinase [Zhenpiania hominis]|uniref:Dephospho-CoA kinase n=1 Tax=Zhenpiania hominis TaxID=2763644 RepID=A0A923NM64_9FIRM|nr:dephospho-CoA kinase [Zhenpiania hominis]MBC6679130.1 dephospho-CoA kinase [Zhenpiania hominis]